MSNRYKTEAEAKLLLCPFLPGRKPGTARRCEGKDCMAFIEVSMPRGDEKRYKCGMVNLT
jgi:hypothetical protein